jgi:hypothetical protein
MTQITKDKLKFITPGNQVYRGVEVDYSTYQQQSQQQSEQQPRIYRGVEYVKEVMKYLIPLLVIFRVLTNDGMFSTQRKMPVKKNATRNPGGSETKRKETFQDF